MNPYALAVKLRNFLYDRGILEIKKVPIPVISVGNISVGGTGKTSLVRFLAENLSKSFRVCVLMRGYKRKSKGALVVSAGEGPKINVLEAGDEAYMIARILPGVSVVVAERRYEGALLAIKEIKPDLIILDDGFQHRSLFRDLDIVLLRKRDLTDRLLPFGRLREPLSSLKRADAVVLSYQEVEPFEFSFQDKPVFKMFRSFRILDTRLKPVSPDTFKGERVVAFCGLGSNDQFFKALRRIGIDPLEEITFPDHYHYKDFKIDTGKVYVTTLKDLIKLPPAENLFAVDVEVKVEGLVEFISLKGECKCYPKDYENVPDRYGRGSDKR